MYSLEWAQTVQYCAPLIPRAVRHISAQNESKVAPTQSKQGNNEWGVEAMLFASWRGTSCLSAPAVWFLVTLVIY
jgi:hypothetical protein